MIFFKIIPFNLNSSKAIKENHKLLKYSNTFLRGSRRDWNGNRFFFFNSIYSLFGTL